MFNKSCPGSKNFKEPTPSNIKCPNCQIDTEIWSDEVKVSCKSCGKVIFRDKNSQSCLDWCSFAKDCIGLKAYNDYIKDKRENESQI